ncbi:MAG: DUF1926 domain-containing protein, partial [Spirochaetaceae bacterium]|nr:DUF1926 domain-containing protein [Spirochaetaceae bacterium]
VVAFFRDGCFGSGKERRSINLRKTYAFRKGGLTLDYEIENKDRFPAAFRMFTEMNLAAGFEPELVGLCAVQGHLELPLDSSRSSITEDATGLRISNLRHEERIEARSDRPFSLSHSPCFTLTEIGAEIGAENGGGPNGAKRYQGCRILIGWDLDIPTDTSQRFSITLELRS